MDLPHIAVRDHLGAPALFVDDQPTFPLMMMTSADALRDWNAHRPFGLKMLTLHPPLGWTSIGTYDFEPVDRAIRAQLEQAPDALLLLRVHLDPPTDWLDANPRELVQYADHDGAMEDGSWGGARKASFASRKWIDDACAALRAHVDHIAASSYAGNILGWHLGAGIYGEWHYPNAVYLPDTSDVFTAAYRDWLVEQGRDASEARIPTADDRRRGDVGMFRDPATNAWQIDYARFLHHTGAVALQAFARVVKQQTDGRSLVLAFNGYLPDLGLNHEIDHRAFDKVVAMPEIDAFSSPHTYQRRAPGDDAMLRGFLGSVRARGKLWIDENDERTHLTGESPWTHVATLEESIELAWRSFAQCLTQSGGQWIMDQGANWYPDKSGPWYRDPEMIDAIEQMQRVAMRSMQRPRRRVSRVAVVMDLESMFHTASIEKEPALRKQLDELSPVLTNQAFGELNKCGVPFDVFDLGTFVDMHMTPQVYGYSTIILLDAWALTQPQRDMFNRWLDGTRTVICCYAAGLLTETGIDVGAMSDLLGMPIELIDEDPAIGRGQRPGFRTDAQQLVPGLPTSERGAGTIFYDPTPPTDAATLRRVLVDFATQQPYLDTNDVLMVNASYIGVHAVTSGEKTLRHRCPCTWRDVRTDEVVARDRESHRVTLERGQTALFELDWPAGTTW